MIERGLILTGSDAELLSQTLEEVKTKVYAESEASLDDAQALDALVSRFRDAAKIGMEKETGQAISPLNKHIVLGAILVGAAALKT